MEFTGRRGRPASACALLLFPSLYYLFRVFKQRAMFGPDDPPPSGEPRQEGDHT